MPSTRSLTAVFALVGSALAQTTSVTTLYLYGFEGDDLVASVVSAAPQSTEYYITCSSGGDECGFGPGVTFTEGPSTMAFHLTESGEFTMDVDCAIASQTASCIETDAGPEANFPGTSTTVVTDMSESLSPVTITAGLELLSGGSSATATSSGSSSGATTEATTGASVTSSAATKTASSTISGTASTSAAATGAAHRVGQHGILAGLMGFVGMAMIL